MPSAQGNILFEYLWIIPLIVFWFILLRIFFSLWNLYITYRYASGLKWAVFEIGLPKLVGVTPKAMEQTLAGIHGMVKAPTLVEKYIEGFTPHRFSMELVGKNGEAHFYIRIQEAFQDLLRSQIFAQYPDAEIQLAPDYTKALPEDLPNEDYNLWGADFIQTRPDSYPIRTYPHFKEEMAEEEMIDPLAAVIEVFNSLRPGEQIWLQILCEATHDKKWEAESKKEVDKLIGRKAQAAKEDIFAKAENLLQHAAWQPGRLFGLAIPSAEKKEEEAGLLSKMQSLSPGEKTVVEAIEEKAAKFGFRSKIRFVYIAKREIFSLARVSAVFGAWKQFAASNLNGFMPDPETSTRVNYFMKDSRLLWRKRKIIMRYRYRSFMGAKPYILNLEELATLYHFPSAYVKSPATPRIDAKKGAAPVDLPI